MSLVGNFTFNNYDGTAQTSGAAGNRGTPYGRRSSLAGEDAGAALHQRTNSTHYAGEEAETPPANGYTDEQEQQYRDNELQELARKMSRASAASREYSNPFEGEKDSALDPSSKNFRARQWAKAMVNLNASENKNPMRTAGIAFKDLNVHGEGAATDYQKDVANVWLDGIGYVKKMLGLAKPRRIDILRDFEGIVHSGEMLVVLGPPGSGCSTFLKTISGETGGFKVDKNSYLNYQGIPNDKMHTYFRGEAIYTAEVDVHFPMMTVSDTLTFAARARAPKHIPGGLKPKEWAAHMRDVIMATYGISHTKNTNVGNDFVRGVSGGERKRVTIAEATLSGAPLQCWDNSTRGLDSANAVEFCKTVRLSTELGGSAACVAIYQAPQSAFDVFDKALVLYQGRQIFFGRTTDARGYFERLGFHCPDRQTTADFLTSMTSPQERVVAEGFEKKVPRTPDEFAAAWKASPERAQLIKELEEYDRTYPFEGENYQKFLESRKIQQAKGQRYKSPYTLSYGGQIELCLWRGFLRLRADPSLTFTQLFGNVAMALVLGSVFYQLPEATASFFGLGGALFFAILLNAFGSALEILTLYAQRPIVEKHARYALYHPSAEAYASMLTDMPYKILNAIFFNTTLYWMVGLRPEAGPFFFFVFISFILTLTMSMLFRTMASVSRTLSQAMVPAAVLILGLVMFTGFAIPVNYMLGWSRWMNYINPIAYGFEALMINEFANRQWACSALVPPDAASLENQVCGTVGAVVGQDFVDGTTYLAEAFEYFPSHRWRNVGIIFAFMVFLMLAYLGATEFISAKKSKGEVLLFRMGHKPKHLRESAHDEETADVGANGAALEKKESYVEASDVIEKQTAIFSWRNLTYDIKIKSEECRILNYVDGWVKPGTLTALMGVSGAGKTTLLDVLATRTTMGVISGDIWVDGRQRDSSFQRKTGYVQQQDLHLETSTVREALIFSAVLRQPAATPRKEKVEYVEEVIRLLDMEEYADAVVGVPGEGLNVEQRKRLTIGVELAAKPALLLFLDEPTSGLDSQTSWAILDLLEKLKNSGQAILCTIHQPSAMLFQRFDRLLFLAAGGKTVYFGEVGADSRTLTTYFERNGAHTCPRDANPAEWMLEVIGAAPGSHTEIDWHETWRNSQEYAEVHKELDYLENERPKQVPAPSKNNKSDYREFAAPMGKQIFECTYRVFQQYWRTPSYIYSKVALCFLSSIFVGFAFFNADLTQQGLTNQMFAIFLMFTIFGQLVQQIMPHFVMQRALYEVRERPSKSYSWKAFMFANIFVELPWNFLMGTLIFFCLYYPVGLYNNATSNPMWPSDDTALRGAQFWLMTTQFLLFTSTFTHMVIAGIPTAETGGNIANLMFSLTLIFCGVLAGPDDFPGFWIFMYRISPFTYLVSGMLGAGLANNLVECSETEYLTVTPPDGQNCQQFFAAYQSVAGGYLLDENATDECNFCQIATTNDFLSQVNINYSDYWRNFGILWAYIIFNIFAAIMIYWLVRVPKGSKKKGGSEKTASENGAGKDGSKSHDKAEKTDTDSNE